MQFLAASFRGINDFASNRMKSHNVHSEIVFSFSPNNNVSICSSAKLFL
jgi:EKC/KEOPS complex subunit CGI121/TPRKB